MATFVLVHGAWHGSWCWKRVRRALQNRGHEVFTPTLTGIGERSHLLAQTVDLETHTLDVLNLIRWEELTDFVLCGHSYGGMVVSGVADRVPERVRALVFLDAFVPDDGQCLADFAPVSDDGLIDGWKCPPITATAFGVNPADREWVDHQCTVQSVACFRQPARLMGRIASIQNISYAYATGWAGYESPFRPFYAKAGKRGWKTAEIDGGHDLMLDRPDEVSRLLIENA